MTRLISICLLFLVSGCVTLSGNYTLSAYDAEGNLLNKNVVSMASGSGIYTVRNALCLAYPKSTVVIIDQKTGKPLESESPYQCR